MGKCLGRVSTCPVGKCPANTPLLERRSKNREDLNYSIITQCKNDVSSPQISQDKTRAALFCASSGTKNKIEPMQFLSILCEIKTTKINRVSWFIFIFFFLLHSRVLHIQTTTITARIIAKIYLKRHSKFIASCIII